ncbi:MAG: hypothetical protein H6573_12115 [Lewinellaceae bacterium]|nr:hypothetical protein [Lewinellaceae bacterium]
MPALPAVDYPVVLDSGLPPHTFCKVIAQDLKRDYIGNEKRSKHHPVWESNYVVRTVRRSTQSGAFNPGTKPVFQKVGYTYRGKKKHYYAYFANHRIKILKTNKGWLLLFPQKELVSTPYFVITNRLNWYPSGILRLRRQRYPSRRIIIRGQSRGLGQV